MASHDQQWYMDTGATSHISSHTGNLQTSFLNRNFHSVIVGNGSSIPAPTLVIYKSLIHIVPSTLEMFLSHPISLKTLFQYVNSPPIIDAPYGFTIRDYHTRQTLLRCDSTGDLYPLHVAASAFAILTNNHSLWHQRLSHPDDNLDTSLIALRLLTTPTSPQQTPPQITPQTTPPTPLSTPSPQTTPTPPITPPPPPPPTTTTTTTSQHHMVTRSKVRTVKANPKYNLHVTTSSPIPKSPFHALRDPNWKQAMCDEYKALIDNNTWVLVPRPPNVNIVRSMWLYKHKYNADGSLSRYKARLVANGRSQQQGIDCDETFSPVVKPATIRTVLSLAVSRQWPIHQLDVKNAFLHGHLTETVYMHQPPGFTDSAHSDYVCLLQKSLYGLKQAPELGFSDFSAMLFESTKYATEILERVQMLNCNPCRTLVDTEKKLGPEGSPVTDPTLYRSLAGALQYLTFTRPDLSYAVQHLCLYMHDPREPHLNVIKLVLRCKATRRSTSGYCVFLGDNLLTWSFKRQDTLSRSSAEAEYRGVVNVVVETSWIRNLVRELHTPLFTATLVYCDNVIGVYMYANPVQHQRTKHIEIDIHFFHDKVAAGHVRVLHVPSRF
ncbi:ribonuclease H-like domain-containing protein [Tanacetum coccineum]